MKTNSTIQRSESLGLAVLLALAGGLLLPCMGRWTVLAAVLLQAGAFLWMCL